jgi:hypothetical protein
MIVTANMLVKVKAYADKHWPGDNQENRIAQQSYLDGYQAAYNINAQELLEYGRMLQQDGKWIKLHQLILAVLLGMLLRGWI